MQLAALARHSRPDLAAWVWGALQRWRAGEGAEHAFVLSGRGAEAEARDALRRAAKLIDPCGARRAWAVAGDIETALRRTTKKLRAGDYITGPPERGGLDHELWVAAVIRDGGVRVPASRERIAKILTDLDW